MVFLGLSPTVFRGYYNALIENHSVKMRMSLEDAKTDILFHSPSLKALDEYMYGKSMSSEYGKSLASLISNYSTPSDMVKTILLPVYRTIDPQEIVEETKRSM